MLIEYARDYLFSNTLRIINSDYDKVASTKLEKDGLEQILNFLTEIIGDSLNELRVFLIENQVFSPEIFEKKFELIQSFIKNLVKTQIETIKATFTDLEG